MTDPKQRMFKPKRSTTERRPSGLRIRDSKTGDLMILQVEGGELKVSPIPKRTQDK